jgi:hypothetical protein
MPIAWAILACGHDQSSAIAKRMFGELSFLLAKDALKIGSASAAMPKLAFFKKSRLVFIIFSNAE